MKKFDKKLNGIKKLIVMPSARRGGGSERPVEEPSESQFVERFLHRNKHNKNLSALTDKIELFTSDVSYQLELMRSALERGNLQTIDVVAKKLASRCDGVGASRMTQICYQIHMSARLQAANHIDPLLEKLHYQFNEIKEKLVVAV